MICKSYLMSRFPGSPCLWQTPENLMASPFEIPSLRKPPNGMISRNRPFVTNFRKYNGLFLRITHSAKTSIFYAPTAIFIVCSSPSASPSASSLHYYFSWQVCIFTISFLKGNGFSPHFMMWLARFFLCIKKDHRVCDGLSLTYSDISLNR